MRPKSADLAYPPPLRMFLSASLRINLGYIPNFTFIGPITLLFQVGCCCDYHCQEQNVMGFQRLSTETSIHLLGIKKISRGELIQRAFLVNGVRYYNREQEMSVVLRVVILIIELPTDTDFCLMIPEVSKFCFSSHL